MSKKERKSSTSKTDAKEDKVYADQEPELWKDGNPFVGTRGESCCPRRAAIDWLTRPVGEAGKEVHTSTDPPTTVLALPCCTEEWKLEYTEEEKASWDGDYPKYKQYCRPYLPGNGKDDVSLRLCSASTGLNAAQNRTRTFNTFTFPSYLTPHHPKLLQVLTIETCYKLEELDIMFMVTMMCGPRYINGIIFMSRAFREQSGVKKGIMSLPFFNNNNSENFYRWCDNMYRKVLIGNEIDRSIKTFRHGTSDMVTAPVNFQLPNKNKDVVVSRVGRGAQWGLII